MAVVHFTAHLARHLACLTARVGGATVRAALEEAFAMNPRLRSYVLDDHGALRQHVNVFVNDESVRDRAGLSDRGAAADELFVFQALSGG